MSWRAAERWPRAARAWLGQPAGERRRVLGTLALWAGTEVALRFLALPTVCRLFGVTLSGPETEVAARRAGGFPTRHERRIEQTLVAVDRVLRVTRPRGACLRRSLMVGHLVRDLAPVLKLGVTRAGGELEAHAWLEIDSVALAEPRGTVARSYTELRKLL